jgi:hypothetical protein
MKTCGEGKGRFLFLKKKKQKNFDPLDCVGKTNGGPAEQKFFASFLQKRSACLPFS